MTKPKHENSLYIYLKSALNEAIPLEYAIRAAKQKNPEEFSNLYELENRIRQFWLEYGMTEEDLKAEPVIDHSWDILQRGILLNHSLHGRRFLRPLLEKGLNDLKKNFEDEFDSMKKPSATNFFRICDLLHGNNIPYLIDAVATCLDNSKEYDASDNIPLNKFVGSIREPIHIHWGFTEAPFFNENGIPSHYGVLISTFARFSEEEIYRQISEFLYRFSMIRSTLHGADSIANIIHTRFLENEIYGIQIKHKIKRIDGFITPLTGLYCWDLVQQYRKEGRKSPIEDAIIATQSIYPNRIRSVGEDAIRKNYNTVRVAINKVSFDCVQYKAKGDELIFPPFIRE